MVKSPAVLRTGACLNVAYGATMPKIIEKGTPMSQVMIVVEFETKPEHRSQFIDLMRGHAERSRRDDGCLQFDLMLPKDDDKHVFLVEKWRDQEALDAHAKGPMPGNTYKDWIVGRKVPRASARAAHRRSKRRLQDRRFPKVRVDLPVEISTPGREMPFHLDQDENDSACRLARAGSTVRSSHQSRVEVLRG